MRFFVLVLSCLIMSSCGVKGKLILPGADSEEKKSAKQVEPLKHDDTSGGLTIIDDQKQPINE